MPDLAMPERRSVHVNGLRINYLDWGNEQAPPMVCVHGYTGSADAFNAFARHFRDRYHVIAPDVRGHGDSEWSKDAAYQYADQVSDLAGFVDALGLQQFTLVGTSMGGIISMAYATERGDRLVDPGHVVEGDPQVFLGVLLAAATAERHRAPGPPQTFHHREEEEGKQAGEEEHREPAAPRSRGRAEPARRR